MKKSALFILAAIFVIGIQSCSTDLQEEISPENLTITKQESQINKNSILQCTEYVYIYFGDMSADRRNRFYDLAEQHWFGIGNINIVPSSCPEVEIWNVPCFVIPRPKKDERDKAVDAEESMTLGEGGSTIPSFISWVYREGVPVDYSSCIDIQEEDDNNPDVIIGPDGDDDNNPDNNPGLPIRIIR